MNNFGVSLVNAFLFYLSVGVISASPVMAQQDFSIQSEVFQETRGIVVHLPENYDPESKEGYPVLYVLDPDFPDEVTAQVDDLVAQAAGDYHKAKMMPEAIVIGIKNVRRGIDFLPHYYSVTRDDKQVFGNGGKLLAFIKDELIPFAGKQFRTSGHRVFMGHSWGGQFVAYALSQSPETFDAYFITSPSIGDRWSEKTFNALKQTFKQDLDFPDFVYVSVGGDEEEDLKADYGNLSALLKQHLPKQVKFYHETNEGLNHANNGQASQPKATKMYFSAKR